MEIQVIVKSVYGNTLVYPVCDKAKLLAKLVGKKTFTVDNLSIIRDLGYTVNYVAQTV
jgi:hypothetical protein